MRGFGWPELMLLRLILVLAVVTAACQSIDASSEEPTTSSTGSTQPTRSESDGNSPFITGTPIEVNDLSGQIVFDDYEDIFTANINGSGLHQVTTLAGSEFDAAWSPDGEWLVYRDSRRGINEDDEIYISRADGSEPHNLSTNPANDWGPDWSTDGEWIVFNSDRDGTPLSGYLVRPDGTDLRRIETDVWLEYPSFSPDGTHIVFEGHTQGDYDIYVADLASGEVTQLTEAPGDDGWPVWSPDGEWIAFTTERDDCLLAPPDQDCWVGDDPGEHRTVWLMRPDGSEQHRVTPESGQFLAWAPDSQHLLVSGRTLFVVRLDGTGRLEFWPEGLTLPPGGIPDWYGD